MIDSIKFRVYADGRVVMECNFDEEDNSLLYYADYKEYSVPTVIFDFISDAL